MHKYIFLLLALVTLVSCGNKHKTYDPYALDGDSIVAEAKTNAFTVPYKRTDSNLKTLHVKLNDTNSYDIIFDTGCSSMSISLLEFKDLIKSGTINDSDIIGTQVSQLADGRKIEDLLLNIHSVTLTDSEGREHTLHDIQAVVTENQLAPMLMGSAVIDNFAKRSYTVDTQKKTITFD